MRLTFRAKLMAIVGTAAAAFVVLIIAGMLVSTRVGQQLGTIREQYLPRIGLRPTLEAQFAKLRRTFQDAVAAHDVDALAASGAEEKDFADALQAAGTAIDPAQAGALLAALEDYDRAANDVSRRLIAKETGEPIVAAMASMQAKQARVSALITEATAFHRSNLEAAFGNVATTQRAARRLELFVGALCLFLVLLLSTALSRGVLRSLAGLTQGFERFGRNDFARPIQVESRDELGELASSANRMAESLQRLGAERDRTTWIETGLSGLSRELRGELEPDEAAGRVLRFIASYLDVPAAALYYRTLRGGPFRRMAEVAGAGAEGEPAAAFAPGEGLLGQAALREALTVIESPPQGYLRVRSSLGASAPAALVFLPLVYGGAVAGVVELALFKPWTQPAAELLLALRETAAIAIEVALARAATRKLLEETQQQARQLAHQEEELRATNEELRAQQEELEQNNHELSLQAEELERQRGSLERSNKELHQARASLEKKAAELSTVSAYKSQFLANMSHELRTPLNSMLLLSHMLAENEGARLTDKEVQYARTIHAAGADLLALINQVLDLAKVEAGKQDVHLAELPLRALVERARNVFEPLAHEKGLGFKVELQPGLPETLVTDGKRVDQVLNNLLGNAIKFTSEGEVGLTLSRPGPEVRLRRTDLSPERTLAIAVADTGVGIDPADHARIFAPFEQVDAASDRRFGGTGLGLSISRELVALLGGELRLQSTPGQGSTFTVYLPLEAPRAPAELSAPAARIEPPAVAVESGTAKPKILVIDDDATFIETFAAAVQARGLECLVALDGRSGLELARAARPAAIALDVRLPDLDGWKVMEALRAEPATAQIPVCFISASPETDRGLALGAAGYLTKPASADELARVVDALLPRAGAAVQALVVEADPDEAEALAGLMEREGLRVRRAASAGAAMQALAEQRFDALVLDPDLPDRDGLALLDELQQRRGGQLPAVLLYTARAPDRAEAKRLEGRTEAVILKQGPARERLLEELRALAVRPKSSGARRPAARTVSRVRLEDRTVLVVDDDMRTIYAVSAILRARGARVLVADTGSAAMAMLAEHPKLDAVLMDVMMPELDGYETVRRIRAAPEHRTLPVLMLTAKAMPGEEARSLEAGASDYLAKPVDPDQLLEKLGALLQGEADHAG